MTALAGAGAALEQVVDDLHVDLQRVDRHDVAQARTLLTRAGAVVLTGWPVEPDSVVLAAATVLGSRLREIEQVRERTTVDGPDLSAHRDGAHVVVEVHGRRTQLRMPEPDVVLVLCVSPARAGGQSYVVDGYRLVDRLRAARPELHAFLTTVDVDVTSGIEGSSYRPPQACRLVEWTRGGRRVVRTPQSAVPVPRDPDADRHRQLIEAYRDVVAAAAAPQGRDTALRAGEVLVLDNYRCLHGVRAHQGPRTMQVGRARSADAL